MRIIVKVANAIVLSFGMSGCSTAASLFSYDTDSPRHARAATTEPATENDGCARIAARRADDAVMAYYVTEGSSAQQDVYRATYRDCAAWANR